MTTHDARLQEAIRIRESGDTETARTLLLQLAAEVPEDAQVYYQCAWAHDALGMEREAVPYYERALALGLRGDAGHGAFLGLGSTYRALGEYERSLATLQRGLATYPGDRALATFLAMTLYNVGQSRDAVAILLQHLAETSADEGIRRYQRAMLFYAARLDETWE